MGKGEAEVWHADDSENHLLHGHAECDHILYGYNVITLHTINIIANNEME